MIQREVYNMKKLLFTLLLVPTVLFGQRDSVLVQTSIYKVMYSETKQQPLWCEYTVQCPNATLSRSGIDFHSHNGIITSDGADYYNNPWDKGHMCPYKGSNCNDAARYESFSYVNCALQQENLNRGTWRLLENYERTLTTQGTVQVTVVTEWKGSIQVLATGAAVPSGFYKYIRVNGRLVGTWYFPNARPVTSDFNYYKIR